LVEDLADLLQAIDFLQLDLIELRLDGALQVGEDAWQLIVESLADGVHGLLEGLDGLELLELLEVLVLHDEVEAVDVVERQRHRRPREDGVLQLLPAPLLLRDPRLYLLHLHRAHYGPQRRRLRVLVRCQLAQLGRVRQRQILHKLGEGLDDGDEVRHGHLPLDDVSGHDEQHSRDRFFLVIGHQCLGLEGEEGGGAGD
jgi:hypothetical protein